MGDTRIPSQTMNIVSVSLHILSLTTLCALAGSPWGEGDLPVEHKFYNRFTINGLDHELDVWTPDAEGNFPVIYFLGGLGGIIPGVAYDTLMRGISSHGYIVLQPWVLISNPGDNYAAEWLVGVQEWIEDNLEGKLHGDNINAGMHIDNDDVFLMGHSSGSHVIVEYLKHHCNKVKGQILFSPVDGLDPFGLVELFAITPGEYLNYEVPTLVIMAGLDNQPGFNIGNLVPACAPDDLSNTRFYNAMPGNTWFVNATAYGHGDCLDEFYYDAMMAIHFCGSDKTQDRVTYRSFAAGEIVSFMNAILYGQCDELMYIEDPSRMTVDATVMKKESVTGSGWECGMPAFCNWQEDPYPNL